MALRSFPSGPWSPELKARGLAWDEAVDNRDLERLSFVMDAPAIDGEGLSLTLWVVNESDASATLAVSGFGLEPVRLHTVAYVGPPMPGPPAPPASVQFVIPARSRVGFSRVFRRADWAFGAAPFAHGWLLRDHRGQTLASGRFEGLVVP